MHATLDEQVRAYIGEQTGLPSETIHVVLMACQRFWVERYPDLTERAVEMVLEEEEERE